MCGDENSSSKLRTPDNHDKKTLPNSLNKQDNKKHSKSPSCILQSTWNALEMVHSGEDGVAPLSDSDDDMSVDSLEAYGDDEMDGENVLVHMNPPIRFDNFSSMEEEEPKEFDQSLKPGEDVEVLKCEAAQLRSLPQKRKKPLRASSFLLV